MIYLFIFEVQTVLKLFSGLIFVDIYRERLIKVDRLVVFVETCSRVSYKNISTRFNVNRSCYGNRRCLLELLLVKKKKKSFLKSLWFLTILQLRGVQSITKSVTRDSRHSIKQSLIDLNWNTNTGQFHVHISKIVLKIREFTLLFPCVGNIVTRFDSFVHRWFDRHTDACLLSKVFFFSYVLENGVLHLIP